MLAFALPFVGGIRRTHSYAASRPHCLRTGKRWAYKLHTLITNCRTAQAATVVARSSGGFAAYTPPLRQQQRQRSSRRENARTRIRPILSLRAAFGKETYNSQVNTVTLLHFFSVVLQAVAAIAYRLLRSFTCFKIKNSNLIKTEVTNWIQVDWAFVVQDDSSCFEESL